jgi:hypothetical protein
VSFGLPEDMGGSTFELLRGLMLSRLGYGFTHAAEYNGIYGNALVASGVTRDHACSITSASSSKRQSVVHVKQALGKSRLHPRASARLHRGGTVAFSRATAASRTLTGLVFDVPSPNESALGIKNPHPK